MKKDALRKQYKLKRKELSKIEKEELQNSVYNQVFNIDFSFIKTVHIFLSIKRLNELNTQPIINFLRTQQKTIVISKSDFKNNTLAHFIYDKNTIIETNSWGIPEPINAKKIAVKKIDLVFVPLLISDHKNYRVGYGKGFYDRFLTSCRPDTKTIGLNFFKPINNIEDIHQFDIPLDKVITPI